MIYHTFIAGELVAARVRDQTDQASRYKLAAPGRSRHWPAPPPAELAHAPD